MANKKSPTRFVVPVVLLGVVAVGGLGVFDIGPAAGWLSGLTSDDTEAALPGPQVKRGPMVISVTQRGNLSAKNAEQVRNGLWKTEKALADLEIRQYKHAKERDALHKEHQGRMAKFKKRMEVA